MIVTDRYQQSTIDIESLSFERGAHLLLKKKLSEVPIGGKLAVFGDSPDAAIHLRAWCRTHGHEFATAGRGQDSSQRFLGWVTRGSSTESRWRDAISTGNVDATSPGAVKELPSQSWGLAARGALVERGGPEFNFDLCSKTEVWTETAPRLYAQAAASQWDPSTVIRWSQEFEIPEEVERAVVQVMTYLIENENAALLVPAKFISKIHPHFREVIQFLALQVADEARHVEVFTKRANLRGGGLGFSTVSGQQSLKTLIDEPDFSTASFLLSVLGEGTFLNLLWFLEQHAPDPITRQIANLTARDEARHVAFGLAHLQYQVQLDQSLRARFAAAIHRRHDLLANTAGLNEEVFDALVLLAAGEWSLEAISRGHELVHQLHTEMHKDRRDRLVRLGFSFEDADALSALHTRNFM